MISVSLDDIVKNTQLRPGTKVYARTDQGNHIKLFDYRTKVDSVDKTSEHLKAIEFSDCCENEIQSRDDTDGEEEKIEVKLENSSFEAVYIRDLSGKYTGLYNFFFIFSCGLRFDSQSYLKWCYNTCV